MTTVYQETSKCPICKNKISYAVLGSTNSFGSPDLDTRPPEMMRSTICYWLIECPECGYVSKDMNKRAPVGKEFLSRTEYKTCDGFKFKSNLTECFYRHHLIMKAAGDNLAAVSALVEAAWTCDDSEDERAPELRSMAVELVDNEPGEIEESTYLMRADLLRRSFQFDRVIHDYENKKFSEELLTDIARFQVKLAREHDSGCYTVEYAIESVKNEQK